MNTILLVEDDFALVEIFQSVLEDHQYQVFTANNGNQALDILASNYIDLIITDIMMPQLDGFAFIKLVRESNEFIPILIISAKDALKDKEIGFRIGVDDYMVKPIDVNEMLLRVEALMRRSKIATSNLLTIGQTSLDHNNYSVTVADHTEMLPQKEFLLLFKLLAYPDKIFTRQQLMDQIWGLDTESDERTIDVHIKRLRDRFKDNQDFSIITIRGLGYKAEVKE